MILRKCEIKNTFQKKPLDETHMYIYLNAKKSNSFLNRSFFFFIKNSASDNVIAKYRYLPCVQHQNQTAVIYGWGAATRNVRQHPFLKSQSSKLVPILQKKKTL